MESIKVPDTGSEVAATALVSDSDEWAGVEEDWTAYQSRTPGFDGGQFTAPGGQRFALPFDRWGWIWLQHDLPAPTTLRYLIDRREVDSTEEGVEAPVMVTFWNPETGEGLQISGYPSDFEADNNRSHESGGYSIGWDFPERPVVDTSGTETAEEDSSGNAPPAVGSSGAKAADPNAEAKDGLHDSAE